MMMEALTVEELALQRIFDLKNEVALEFESHQRLFNEALLFNVFLKGFDPPPWLSVSGKRGEIPILPSRRGSYSVFRVGSGGTRVHLQDSVKSFREQDRFSELYGGFLCKRKRVSSSVDRPSCLEVVAAKKPRVEESDFVVAREIDGDQGKGLDKDIQEEVKGKEHGFGDGQHGENEDRRHLFDERHGGNEGEQGLFDAQLGRNEENIGSQGENGECVEKGARFRPSRRGAKAKEKKNDAVSPFVGRITRARAKNCQVLLSAKEDICKKRTAVRSRQPRGRRKNASATGASGLEVSEEPAMELLSSAAAVKAEIGGKASPLMAAFEIEDQLSASPKMTKSQTRNESSPVVAESQVEVKLSSAMKRMQNEDHSSPLVNHSQIEDHAQRDDFGCTEGTTKKSKVTYASFEPGSRGSEDIDHKNAQVEKDTSENVERCVEGETVPMDDFRRIVDSCDAEQLVTSNLTDTSHKQEMPNVMENVQQHEISDLTESTQLKLREEEHPVDFQNQPKDNFYLVEENAERKVPSVLTPLENRKSMDAIPIHTTLVSNATCTPQEMVASRFKEIFSGKVDLLDDSVKSTPTLVQEILSNPRYCGKSGFSDAPHHSKRSNVFERSVFSDQGCHPISVIASGVVQDAPDSPSIEGTGHKLSLKADASDMTVMDVPLRCETEDANAIGIGLGEISVCPNEKIPDQVEPNTTLCEERDEFEKVNPSNLGFIHHKTASFDSALGLSCHILHKSESDVTGDLTIKLRSRSVDCCKRIFGEETNNGSNVVASTGGHECLKAVSFRMFRGLSGSSVKLLSQGNEDQNLKGGRSASPVDVSAKISPEVKDNSESQMPEDSKLMSMTEKVDEAIFYRQKPWASQGKLGAYDSALAISSPDEAAEGQIETSCNAPSKKLVVADMELMDRTLLSSGNLFSRNMAEVKEEGGMELQHNSWPKYQKRSGLVQQQFHSAGQPRLCQTESCSKILDYNPSIRLSNGGIEVTSNKDACLVSHNDEVAKPSTCDSERNCDMEYSEERPDNITNILLLKDFACVGSNSTEAFPDRQSPSLISSQTKKDVKQSPRYGEHRQRAKLILEECSTRMGLYPRQSLTALGEGKCRIGNENVRRSSPSCLSYSTTNEGAFAYTGSSQVRVDGMHFQATDNNTSPACLQGQVHLHAAPLKSCSFRSSFEVTSPQNHGAEGDCKLLPEDDTVSDFSFQKGLSGMENNDMESTPLLKGGVVRQRSQCSPAKLLLVNQKPLNQLKLAGLKSHENFSDEVDASISEISQRKKRPSLEVDCEPKVNSSISGFAKGAAGSLGMPQLVQPSCSFSSTNQTVDSVAYDKLFQSMQLASMHDVKMLQEFEGFHNGLLSKDNNFKSGKGNECVEIDMEYERIGDKNGKYSSTKGGVKGTELCKAFHSLTPDPNHISKCRTHVPLKACSSHAMGLQEHKESPGEYQGKRNAINDSYMAAHGLPTDKFQMRSGFNGVVGYGPKIKNSPSSTPASGAFFERISKKSMNMDSKSFPRKVHMFKGHSGCFPIEEENSVEEESMDHPISLKHFTNRSGSSTKKSVLGAKKILMDSSSARHNSLVTTPTGGKLFERISTNYTDTGSNLLPKKAYLNQNNANCFNNEEEVGLEKENREPSVSVNEFQKNFGSSVKKKVLRDHNTEACSSNASHISLAKSHQKSNNLLSNVRSFIPLVQQKPAAASIMTGKRDVKVKALEVAEAAKRMEEKKEHERKMRKELARRGEHEKNFQEKPKEEHNRGEKEGEETIRATSDCSNKSISNGVVRKKPVGCALPKSHADNSSQLDTSACGVDLKLKRALEAKTKLEQEKVKKLEEEQRRKEEERKKKEAELAAKKRKREEIERRDREEKRKRLEEAQRQQKETEEQLRADKEAKEQRRRALDEYERKRKAMEEEAKKQRRIEKEKEAAERRRRLEEDAKANKFLLKDAKHLEEIHQQHEATLQAHKANAGKVSSMCNSFSKSKRETEGQSVPDINKKLLQSTEPDINIQSYEISPYKGSDEEDDDEDAASGKFIPLWARKENLIQHLTRQQYIDPDEIFTGSKTCSLNEVFGTNGSLRRTDFNRRSKSGEWLADKFTWKEEYQYKLQMGYINKG